MDFGSSHIFTQADSDTEELTAEDFESPIYQGLGDQLSPQSSISQPDACPDGFTDDGDYNVLYDNVIRDQDQHARKTEYEEPIYDNRGFEAKPKPQLPKRRRSGDYAKPYDHLRRESHPYDYAGLGSFTGSKPPPLPPMRKKTTGDDDGMGEPIYGEVGEGEYQELLYNGSSKVRRADTNIVAVKFDKLVQPSNVEEGKLILCGCCGAAMSHLSTTSQLYSGKFWICEFCEFENPVSEQTENPGSEDCTYVMGHGSGGGADTVIIFCVDVSGSMAVTTEVSGTIERKTTDEQTALQAYQAQLDAAEQMSRDVEEAAIRAELVATYDGAIEEQAQALERFSLSRAQLQAQARRGPAGQEGGDQNPPDENERYIAAPRKAPEALPPLKNVSYISRLQSMQTAIEQQISAQLESESSLKRIGLVAFNNDVTVFGDGSLDPVPLEGAGLTDKESLISLGENFPLPGHIAEVRRCLTDKIYSLTESGQTALGPALLIAISMAAQRPGSKVIMCTDGMANVGLGALHNMDNDAAYEEAVKFYEEVGDFAQNAGVCVSVLTLEGEDCRAIELGSVADKTRGQVSIVRPSELNQQFAEILDDPILATNVSAKMVLHKGLFLRDSSGDAKPGSQATHVVGIVTADSETTFEFGVRKKEVLYDNFGGTTVVEREEEEPIYDSVNQTMIEGLEKLPFQVQISYTGRDGTDYLRILTMDRPVTKNRKFAEQNANVGVIGAHAAQSAAKLAVEGNFGKAQINAIVTQKLVQRCTQAEQGDHQEGIYQTYLANMAPIQSELSRAQQLEAGNGQLMSDGDSGSEYTSLVQPSKKKMSKKMKQRRKNVSDRQASVFYRMKGATTKMFNKQTYNLGEVV